MGTVGGILIIGLLFWFWLDGARAREIATGVCETACRQRQLQFLDQTVALHRMGLRWTSQGIRIRRVFRFEFSEQGIGRRHGHITMLGTGLEDFSLILDDRRQQPGEARTGPPPDRLN